MKNKVKKGIFRCSITAACVSAVLSGCSSGSAGSTTTTAGTAAETTAAATMAVETFAEIENDGWVEAYRDILSRDFYEGSFMYLHDMEGNEVPELLLAAPVPADEKGMIVIPVSWDSQSQKAVENSESLVALVKSFHGEMPETLVEAGERLDLENSEIKEYINSVLWHPRFDLNENQVIEQEETGELRMSARIPWKMISKETVETYVTAGYLNENQKNFWYHDDKGRRYRDENRQDVYNTWIEYYGEHYHLGTDGYLQTGWNEIEGNWYYLYGGHEIEGNWYCPSGTEGEWHTQIEAGYRYELGQRFSNEIPPCELPVPGKVLSVDENGVANILVLKENPFKNNPEVDPDGRMWLYIKNIEKKDGYYELTGAVEAWRLSSTWWEGVTDQKEIEIPLWSNVCGNCLKPEINGYMATVDNRGNFLGFEMQYLADSSKINTENSNTDWAEVLTPQYISAYAKRDEDGIINYQCSASFSEREFIMDMPKYPVLEDAVFVVDEETFIQYYTPEIVPGFYNNMLKSELFSSSNSVHMEEYFQGMPSSEELKAHMTKYAPDYINYNQEAISGGEIQLYPKICIEVDNSSNYLKSISGDGYAFLSEWGGDALLEYYKSRGLLDEGYYAGFLREN